MLQQSYLVAANQPSSKLSGMQNSRANLEGVHGRLKYPLQNFTIMYVLARNIVEATVQVQLHLKHTWVMKTWKE